jgi:hypothetical protein
MTTQIKSIMDNVERGMKQESTQPFRTYEGWMDVIQEYVTTIVKGKDAINKERVSINDANYSNIQKESKDYSSSSSSASSSVSSSVSSSASSSSSFPLSFSSQTDYSKFENKVTKEKRKNEWLE